LQRSDYTRGADDLSPKVGAKLLSPGRQSWVGVLKMVSAVGATRELGADSEILMSPGWAFILFSLTHPSRLR